MRANPGCLVCPHTFASMHGISADDRTLRIRDVCELTDLRGREDVYVKGLSTGNRQFFVPLCTEASARTSRAASGCQELAGAASAVNNRIESGTPF